MPPYILPGLNFVLLLPVILKLIVCYSYCYSLIHRNETICDYAVVMMHVGLLSCVQVEHGEQCTERATSWS